MLLSPEVLGVALDGDLRKPPDLLFCTRRTDRPFAPNSIVEMHTFLITLIRHFDFSLPENEEVKWRMIFPMVVGEEHKGPQLPLKVTALGNE